ncbi:hypothetical protein K4G97_21315, partial [Mycobacterium tuberculosis]|nr:hypothetical protein [Mycobacterium tuberculosis]
MPDGIARWRCAYRGYQTSSPVRCIYRDHHTVARIRRYAPLSGEAGEIVSRMKGLITAAGLRNRQAQLPDGHRVVGA